MLWRIFNDLSAYLSIQAGIFFQAIWYQIRIHIFDTTPSVIAQLFFFKMQLKLLRLNNKSWNLLSAKFGIKEQNNVNYIFGIYCICLYLNSINFRYPRCKRHFSQSSTQTVWIFYGPWKFEDKSDRWDSFNNSNNSKYISLPKSRKYLPLRKKYR